MLVLLAKNPFLQSERCDLSRGPIPGTPVHETSAIQTRSPRRQKGSGTWTDRLTITHDVIHVSDSSQTRSAHESETLNVGDVMFRERTERSVADHGVSHESMMANEAEIPGPPHSAVKHAQSTSVRNWFRKLRTIRIDTLFNKTYYKINHLIFSVESQNKWCRMLVTSNYVNCSRRNPKSSALCVYHTGTYTARADISRTKKEGRITNSSIVRWTFFQFLSVSSRKEDLTDIDMGKRLGG